MRKYYNFRDNIETDVNILQNVEQEAEDGTPQMLLPKYYTVARRTWENHQLRRTEVSRERGSKHHQSSKQ
jgi:hypothetical protein